MNVYDNLRLASYSVAADAFDKSKDVFTAFIPLVESAILTLPGKSSISFLALRNKINEIYKVDIPKDTLRYILNILEKQEKLDFVQNRTIIPSISMQSTDYIDKQNSAKTTIESFFTAFQEYLSKKDTFPSSSEIREHICNLIYIHSTDLATFIQDPTIKHTISLQDYDDVEEWEYTEDFVLYLLKCKKEKLPEYFSFIKLFDGAIQSTLLNFTPSVIKSTVDKQFKIEAAILDTNFILRLMELQPELDNESAYNTWEDLCKTGTKLIVLQQTIEETCSSIKGFTNEIAPYAQQAQNFLRNSRIRTSGFWHAFQNGKSRTDFHELSKEENVRELLTQKFNIVIEEDFEDDSISQADINSLIASKNLDRYSDKQARHDLLLLSYCRKKRPRRFSSISGARWWVLTNDRKLAYWNQNDSHNIQECITETQFSNLMWLQAKKESDDGLSNTIVTLASKSSVGSDTISSFAQQINKYQKRYANDVSKLDDLSLVFASSILSSDDIQRGTTDEDEFASLIEKKIENIKQEQALNRAQIAYEQERLLQINADSAKANSDLSKEIQSIRSELTETKRQAKRESLARNIQDLQQKAIKYESDKEILQALITFSKKQKVPAARLVLTGLIGVLVVLTAICMHFAYAPVYNWINATVDWPDILLNIISSGVILIVVSPIYYVIVIFIFGAPYQPAELFNHLRNIVVHKILANYILKNSFPSEYSHVNLEFQFNQVDEERKSIRNQITELQQKLDEI